MHPPEVREGTQHGDLGARLCRLRLERGMTQQQLAEPRYTRAFVSSVESGRRTPSGEAVRHFADRLGVETDDLLFGRPPGIAARLRDALLEARRHLSAGQVGRAVETFTSAAETARRYRLTAIEAEASYCQGEALLHRGDPRAAMERYAWAEDLLAEALLAERAPVIARRAFCMLLCGELTQALALLEHTLKELRRDAPVDPDAEVRLLSVTAAVYHEMGSMDRAVSAVEEGLALMSRVRNPEWVARFLMTAALSSLRQQRFAEAEEHLARAHRTFEELGLVTEVGRCHWDRGYVLARVGRLPEAAEQLRTALAILDAAGAQGEMAGPLLELAEVLRRQGELDEAEALARRAREFAAGAGHLEGLGEAYRVEGLVARERGDHRRAEENLRQAVDMFGQVGARLELAATCRRLGELLMERGKVEEAVPVLRRGLVGVEELS